MKYLKAVFILLICVMLGGCPMDDGPDLMYEITNQSDGIIFVATRTSAETVNAEAFETQPTFNIAPDDTLDEEIFSSTLRDSKLWVLVFKQSTLESHTWEEIRAGNLYDQRYELSLDDLQELDFKIVYNGN